MGQSESGKRSQRHNGIRMGKLILTDRIVHLSQIGS